MPKPPPQSQISPRGRALLTDWEGGAHPKAYKDQAGKETIGAGHCLTPDELATGLVRIKGQMIPWKKGLCPEQMDALLDQDLDVAEYAICRLVTVPLTVDQFDALTMLVFNIGAGRDGFQSSTLLTILNAKDYAGVPAQFKRWNKTKIDGVKQVSRGLVNRRAKEVWLWNGGTGPMPAPVK